MIRHKQYKQHDWFELPEGSYDNFWKNIGIFQPLLVETQAEYDYLYAMQFMIGKEMIILLKEEDNPTDTPPTYMQITLPK